VDTGGNDRNAILWVPEGVRGIKRTGGSDSKADKADNEPVWDKKD
jgi:hypothetical protein